MTPAPPMCSLQMVLHDTDLLSLMLPRLDDEALLSLLCATRRHGEALCAFVRELTARQRWLLVLRDGFLHDMHHITTSALACPVWDASHIAVFDVFRGELKHLQASDLQTSRKLQMVRRISILAMSCILLHRRRPQSR